MAVIKYHSIISILPSQHLFRPSVAEVPLVVNAKLEVYGQVEHILYQLVQILRVHLAASHAIVQPAADADIEAVCGLVEEDLSTGDERVVMLLVEDGTGVAFGLGTVVLLLPIGLIFKIIVNSLKIIVLAFSCF